MIDTESAQLVEACERRHANQSLVLASVLELTLSRGLVEVEKDVGRHISIVFVVVLLTPVVESSLLKCFLRVKN